MIINSSMQSSEKTLKFGNFHVKSSDIQVTLNFNYAPKFISCYSKNGYFTFVNVDKIIAIGGFIDFFSTLSNDRYSIKIVKIDDLTYKIGKVSGSGESTFTQSDIDVFYLY